LVNGRPDPFTIKVLFLDAIKKRVLKKDILPIDFP